MTALATASAGVMWPRPLVVEYLDGRNWELTSPFAFVSPSKDYPSLDIPAGFVTDFASIPPVLWNLLSPADKHIGKIAVVHDRYYRDGAIAVTRDEADEALRDGMQALGAPWWKRQIVYRMVRLFGERAYQPRTETAHVG